MNMWYSVIWSKLQFLRSLSDDFSRKASPNFVCVRVLIYNQIPSSKLAYPLNMAIYSEVPSRFLVEHGPR